MLVTKSAPGFKAEAVMEDNTIQEISLSDYKGKKVGTFGDFGCFSFFPTKNLGAAGDGGAVTTSDQNIAKKVRELAVHGSPKRYHHTQIGYNSRLDALQAAVLNIKIKSLSLIHI